MAAQALQAGAQTYQDVIQVGTNDIGLHADITQKITRGLAQEGG